MEDLTEERERVESLSAKLLVVISEDDTPSEESQEEIKHSRLPAYLTLLGSIFSHLTVGAYYLPSATIVYIASYYQKFDASLTINTALIATPFLGLESALVMPFSMTICKKIGLKPTIFLCLAVMSASYYASSFTTNYWIFFLVYSVFGPPTGVLLPLPIWAVQKHFPKHKGKISGVVFAAVGLGSFALTLIARYIVNPDNISPTIVGPDGNFYYSADVYENVPKMLRVMSYIILICGVLATLLIQAPSNSNALQPKPRDSDYIGASLPKKKISLLPIGVILKNRSYWMLFGLAYLIAVPSLYVTYDYKVYGEHRINDDSFLSIVGSFAAICNAAGRFIWGLLMDYFSFKKVFTGLLVLQLALLLTLDIIGHIKVCFFLWVCLIVNCEGALFGIFPTECAKKFGTDNGPRVYGMVGFGIALAGLTQYALNKFLLQELGFTIMFYILAGFSSITAVLLVLYSPKKRLLPSEYITQSMKDGSTSASVPNK